MTGSDRKTGIRYNRTVWCKYSLTLKLTNVTFLYALYSLNRIILLQKYIALQFAYRLRYRYKLEIFEERTNDLKSSFCNMILFNKYNLLSLGRKEVLV